MSAEPINVRAVLTQWLRNLSNHNHARCVEMDQVVLGGCPGKYFQTKFTLACVPDQEVVDDETCDEDAERVVEEDAGDFAMAAFSTNVIKYTDLREAAESDSHCVAPIRRHTDVYVEILVTSPLARCATQPAVLNLFTNGDVEISYYIPTRNPT